MEKDEDGATESMRRRKAEDDEFAGIMRQKILNESMKHVATHGFTDRAIQRAVTEALQRPHEDIGSSTLLVDWASARHETQYTRLFRS